MALNRPTSLAPTRDAGAGFRHQNRVVAYRVGHGQRHLALLRAWTERRDFSDKPALFGKETMGLNMLGADPQWKVLLTGVLIIGAVAIDQWIRKVSA